MANEGLPLYLAEWSLLPGEIEIRLLADRGRLEGNLVSVLAEDHEIELPDYHDARTGRREIDRTCARERIGARGMQREYARAHDIHVIPGVLIHLGRGGRERAAGTDADHHAVAAVELVIRGCELLIGCVD